MNDTFEALEEYDSYADGILSLLLRGANDAEIAQHLRRIETANMGVRGSSIEHLTLVVGALRALDLEPPEAPQYGIAADAKAAFSCRGALPAFACGTSRLFTPVK